MIKPPVVKEVFKYHWVIISSTKKRPKKAARWAANQVEESTSH
jgi:hypothetical protein